MILTSYFANAKRFPVGKQLVSTSLYSPNWFNKEHIHAIELAPTPELLEDYKNGRVDELAYIERYKSETLSRLNPEDIVKKYDGKVLLCYEKVGDFCHRHIVSEWLRSFGINTEEIREHISIAVVGSRGFSDYFYFKKVMDRLVSNYVLGSYSFVSGGAESGADAFIEKYANGIKAKITIHKADWNKYGRSAGFVRNKLIWEDAHIGILFWDGISKGTKHSFSIAEKQNKKLYAVEYLDNKIYTQLPNIYKENCDTTHCLFPS